MSKSVILLSGGLDSLVALGAGINEYGIELALTFDYGQKSVNEEVSASKKIFIFLGVFFAVYLLFTNNPLKLFRNIIIIN